MIGRARGITPEWVQRESLAKCSRDARLLYVYLSTVADDYGRAHASPSMLAGLLFYADKDARELIAVWLCELERVGEVLLYRVRGQPFLQLLAWDELVRPDRFSGRQLPPPPPVGAEQEKPQRELPLVASLRRVASG